MNMKIKQMLFIAALLFLVVVCLFMSGRSKKPQPKPTQYDSIFKYRIDNIKKIDSAKPVLFERKLNYQKKARQKAATAKANIALYKKSIKDGDTAIALQHIDSVITSFSDIETFTDSAQSYGDSIIAKQSVQIAAYEGLLTMTRTEMNRLDKEVKALNFENQELKDKIKRRKRNGVLLTGIILLSGYILIK